MFKKVTTVLLLLSLCLVSFAACGEKSDAPEGFQLIACRGDCFRLYVPTQGWIANDRGGVTSATYSGEVTTTVNVYVAEDAGEMTLEEYWSKCQVIFSELFTDYQAIEGSESVVLGGQPANKYLFSRKVTKLNSESEEAETETFKYMLLMAKHQGDIYLLVYSAPEEVYDSHIQDVEGDEDGRGIIPYFKFAEPYESETEKVYSDKVTPPEGMKLISTDELPYRFYVPTSWTVNDRAEFPAAAPAEASSANITAHMYMISGPEISVTDYFASCEKRYRELFESYTPDGEGVEITMDGVKAMQYTYTLVSGGITYRQMQAIVLKGAVYYTITYTALPEEFDTYLPQAERIIECFDIR